ncbi:MAG TPA: alpha-1,2-fucosyltransferase, partial [Cytophagales bacterium]|nr:alpha-1,2-fucosyltransferase [Cytophagales bacterium]
MTVGYNYLGKLGQLGNQMFQYAATLGVARYTGVPFTIPNHDELVVDSLGNRLRIELFDCFDIKPDKIGFIRTDNVLGEKGFEFDSNILNRNRQSDYTLYGFFQTEKYFQHCADEVRSQFTFKKEIVDECKEIVEECFEEPIALHIRRGDFIINSANHHNQSLDYYEQALKKFDANRQVVIFSDDPDWCMEQALFADDRFIVSQSAGPYHDLYMMSQCSDFIIANST